MHYQQEKTAPQTEMNEDLYSLQPESSKISEKKGQQLISIAKKYYQLNAKFEKEQFFTRSQYYVLQTKWLSRWKLYVSYNEVNGACPLGKYFGCGKMPKANQDLVVKQKRDVIKFPEEYHHFNIKLKPGLQEDKDYVFITKQMHYALSECEDYSMIRIPRQVVKTKSGKKVQLYYLQINTILMFNSYCKDIDQEKGNKFYEINFQYSHYITVQQFLDTIEPIIKKYLNSKTNIDFYSGKWLRLWLLPQDTRKTILHNTFHAGCKANPTFTYKLFLEGTLLNQQYQLGQYDILDDSLLMAQIRESNNNWLFYNSKIILEANCNHCKEKKALPKLCSCKFAAYCSQSCKIKDKPSHRGRCPNDAQSEEDEADLKLTSKSKQGLVGLRNLGNTCFMNSGLQCISHIKEITQYFAQNHYIKDVNKDNPLGTKGQVSTAFAKMIQNLWYGSQSSFSPNVLKRTIAKYQPMFSGYQQHDASQLINYLLDLLHEDLNRVKVKPYVQTKDFDNRPDSVVAAEAWQNFLKRNQSFIVDLLFGQFKSVVDCPKCQYSSIQFDPFSVCSLPIKNQNKKQIQVILIKNHIEETTYKITYMATDKQTIKNVIQKVKVKANLNDNTKIITYVSSYSSCQIIKEEQKIESVRQEHKYRSIIMRQLLSNENPDQDIKILLNNTYCHSIYGNQNYRKNIITARLYFFNKNATNKQVHYKIYSYYKRFYQLANYQSQIIKVSQKEQPFRLLYVSSSNYLPCEYCGKKNCQGCPLPYNDDRFMKDVKLGSKVQMQLYWRKNVKEIQALMEKESNNTRQLSKNKQEATTIQECLKLFSQPQTLQEDNAWYCPKCKDFVLAKKQMHIYKAPKILILTLKRFKIKKYFNEKHTIFVDYPLNNFDLTNFVLNPNYPSQKVEKQKTLDGIKKKVLYDLIAVSNHMGSTGGGHYTAYCKDINSQKWFQFDDSSVSPVKNEQNVVSEAGYILFYRRKDD